jgi:hypothetical protein
MYDNREIHIYYAEQSHDHARPPAKPGGIENVNIKKRKKIRVK